MTPTDRALRRLAQLAGVALGYRDAWNQPRDVSAETLRAILGSMGFAVGSERDLAASATALTAAEWESFLPPAITLVAGDTAATIPVTVTDAGDDRPLSWTIIAENGERHTGTVELDGLEILSERRERRRRLRRYALPIDPPLPPGYHRLTVSIGAGNGETVLILAPRRCYLPAALGEGGAAWGITAQLYALRSQRNWGIGDFTDLAALATGAARQGAATIGINPLHALFPAEPRHISPYSPSSRFFLNPLYLDVEAVPDLTPDNAALPEMATRLAEVRRGDLVDHLQVAALKRPIFDHLYRRFAERHLGSAFEGALSERGAAFRRFQREGGETLARYAIFTALHEDLLAERGSFSWHDWPLPLQNVNSPEVAQFAARHRARVELHQYLQWEADRQLGEVARSAAESGLSIGLYRDLAVGVDGNGIDAWAAPDMMVGGAGIGAPPDLLNLKGQDWGLAPINPVALRQRAYAPFIAALRANMRYAGVLRVDHVMALRHLYWVPRGASPAEGTYVAYPFEDLCRILALESQRSRCAVIGEDLGTVPEGFRETMHDSGVLSYRVLLFERDSAGHFLAPEAYPALAAATFSTHDIATLKGFWLGRDLAWRRELDLYPSAELAERDSEQRRRDRHHLLAALVAAGALPADAVPRLLPRDDEPIYQPVLVQAVHCFLGLTKSRLALMQIEDAIGELDQANLPGTIDEHPNWRRKLSRALDQILDDSFFKELTSTLDRARRSGSRGGA